MKTMFRSIVSGVLIGLLTVGLSPIRAANGDILTYTGSGSQNGIEVFRIDDDGSIYTTGTLGQTDQAGTNGVTLSQGDINLRTSSSTIQFGNGTVVSATATATYSQGTYFTGYLAAGAASPNAVEGSVLCATTTTVGQGVTLIVCPTTLNMQPVVGVAVVAASSGSVVHVYDSGWVNALTTGTVNVGAWLVTSNDSAGYLEAATTVLSTNTVGIALAAGTTAGGLTKIKLVR